MTDPDRAAVNAAAREMKRQYKEMRRRTGHGRQDAVAHAIGVGIRVVVCLGVVAALAWVLLQTSGRTASQTGETGCQAAFRDASDGAVSANAEYDLDPALVACASMGEWTAAFNKYNVPGAGNDARFVAENRCMTGRFDDTPICQELGITP